MRIVIFGNRAFASLAWYVLTHDSEHEVVGFTVDRDYLHEDCLHELPVVPFEEVVTHFPPCDVAMIVPLGVSQLNGLRKSRHETAKSLGYRFVSYVSSKATTWADLAIGENSMVFEGALVQPFAQVGTGVILRAGTCIGHHCVIEDYCFIAAGAVTGGRTRVGSRCFLGLNSTVRDGIKIAPKCIIAAGAVVTQDTEENGVYIGVPAKRAAQPADTLTSY